MNQFVKFLPGIGSLLCLVTALLMHFVWHETTWALLLALLALLLSQLPAPGTAARKRAAQEAAQNREARTVRAQRRRLLADVQAHQRNVARGEGPAASS
ncbi:hypothetical protein [Kocuria rhizophila]|uniref:hypothetical protein n=1 Tax=Kocuria rhizophila TaxID=72000 RepID=UPI000C876E27|nr:hypothetical protein [Kocuria rhizophila]MCT1957289.1 hypothetical protein [Kocuria rhizophila]MCT2072999.1 hypothetical protein [Kocuria rhizophila]PMR91987.1 hypothetical protein C1H83_00910 [Kocuria rhizophila]